MKKWIIALLLAPTLGFAQTDWTILKDKATVKFKIKNFGLWVEGTLGGLDGYINFDPVHPETAKIQGKVLVNTINTGISKRDEHLKSPDYFDSAKYPYIQITANSVSKSSPTAYTLNGTLTMHGVSKPITFPFIFLEDNGRGIFTASFKVLRADYGIGSDSGPLGDEVQIELSIPATR